MKKFTLAALIFVATITHAETIKPKEEVIFDKGVCIDVQAMDNCQYQQIKILNTGIEWLNKELLLNAGLLKDNQGRNIKSSNKSFAELKTQLKQQHEKEFNNFGVYVDDKKVTQPKKWLKSDEIEEGVSVSNFSTKFIKQNDDTIIFVTYDEGCSPTGHCGEVRREIHFDLKTKKRTHLQSWRKTSYSAGGWEELSKEELDG